MPALYLQRQGRRRPVFSDIRAQALDLTGQFAPIDQQYSQFITPDTGWLREVPSQVLRNGTVRWKQAYSRYFAKLGGRPVIHKKHGEQSVWLTAELFAFVPKTDTATGEVVYALHLGTKKHSLGVLAFTAHKDFKIPSSLHASTHARRWHISFNYDDGVPEPDDAETAAWLRQFDADSLRAMTVGLDRGVVIPLAGSDGQQFVLSPAQRRKLDQEAARKKRWQRRQARRVAGSGGQRKAKAKVARYSRYAGDVRREFAHQTSHRLAADVRYRLYVFEALKVKNMTAKVKPKQDPETGKWLRNGARAKSGLNKSILASAWGQTKTFLQYKARRRGKLAFAVPAAYSSQECAACGHTHQDNRVSQSGFVCQACRQVSHADHNAAQVIASRGVALVLSGNLIFKKKKRCGVTKRKETPSNSIVGAEGSERVVATRPTPRETQVRRAGGHIRAHKSLNLETPATSQRL